MASNTDCKLWHEDSMPEKHPSDKKSIMGHNIKVNKAQDYGFNFSPEMIWAWDLYYEFAKHNTDLTFELGIISKQQHRHGIWTCYFSKLFPGTIFGLGYFQVMTESTTSGIGMFQSITQSQHLDLRLHNFSWAMQLIFCYVGTLWQGQPLWGWFTWYT